MKHCPHCGRNKPTDAFGSDRSRPDGLSSWCRACKREDARRQNARPERKAAKLAWQRRAFRERLDLRGVCSQCGAPLGDFAWNRPTGRCRSCRAADVEARANLIVEWWAEGLLLREIASRLGWTTGHIAQEIDRLRKKGYDLPLRYPTVDGKRVAA